MELVFERTSATIELIKSVFHSAIELCFSAIPKFKFINTLLSSESTLKFVKTDRPKMFTNEFQFFAELIFSSYCKQHN